MLHARSAVEGGRRAHKRCPDHCRAQWCRIGGMPLRQLHAVAQAVMRVDVGRAPTCKSCSLFSTCSEHMTSDEESENVVRWGIRSSIELRSVFWTTRTGATSNRVAVRVWEESSDFPRHTPPTRGPSRPLSPPCTCNVCCMVMCVVWDAVRTHQRCVCRGAGAWAPSSDFTSLLYGSL